MRRRRSRRRGGRCRFTAATAALARLAGAGIAGELAKKTRSQVAKMVFQRPGVARYKRKASAGELSHAVIDSLWRKLVSVIPSPDPSAKSSGKMAASALA